ncbi:hypothetical protein M5E87_12265 [Flavonifractor plautii]|nr:hypothetical protein M5E87_12265 [Flavonifractor plautii]
MTLRDQTRERRALWARSGRTASPASSCAPCGAGRWRGQAGAGRPLWAGGPGEWGGSLPMKILKMRATFGKLQGAELALGRG